MVQKGGVVRTVGKVRVEGGQLWYPQHQLTTLKGVVCRSQSDLRTRSKLVDELKYVGFERSKHELLICTVPLELDRR